MDTNSNFQTFTYTVPATAVAVNFNLGGIPDKVEIFNKGGTSGKISKAEWTRGMADASAFLTVTNGTRSLVTSNGITPSDELTTLDASDTTFSAQGRDQNTIIGAPGFTLGTLTDINTTSCAGDVLVITAWTSPSGQ